MNPWELSTYWESSDIEFDSFLNESFNNDELMRIIYEASQTATKKNFFATIWELIKKAVAFIIKNVKKLISGIKAFITGNKSKTSADDIMSQHVSHPLTAASDSNTGGSNQVQPLASEDSTVTPPTLEAIAKDISAKFEKDNSITFTMKNMKGINIRGVHDKSGLPNKRGRALKVITCLKHPDYVKSLSTLLNDIVDIVKLVPASNAGMLSKINGNAQVRIKAEKISEQTRKLLINIDDYNLGDDQYNISYQEFNNFGKQLSSIYDILIKIDNNYDLNQFNRHTRDYIATALNIIGGITTELNFGMNALSSAIQQIYQVDAKYEKCIDNLKDLADVTEQMIKSGIPTKFVMWNVFFISNPKLYGKESRNHPKWGQSRVVFIPQGNNEVYKIALNSEGMRANNIELKLYAEFKAHNLNDVFCKTWCSCGNSTIINAEYVPTTLAAKEGNVNGAFHAARLSNEINNKIRAAGLRYYINDLHHYNFGINKDGNIVATDYGAFQHI